MSGARADDTAKVSVEMRLVCKSACQRDIRESLPCGCHHKFGTLDSSYGDIRHGGTSQTMLERSREMTRAQGHGLCHFFGCHPQSKICLDEIQNSLRLPRRKATW